MGYQQTQPFDRLRTGGQPRRKPVLSLVLSVAEVGAEGLNTRRAKALFGFKSQTTFEEGLQRTIDWYVDHIGNVREIKYD